MFFVSTSNDLRQKWSGKTPATEYFMKHMKLVEGPLSVPVDHVGDEFIHSWLAHGEKATQPHTEWR